MFFITLSSRLLIQSSDFSDLLLIHSNVCFIVVIVVFISIWFFFMFSVSFFMVSLSLLKFSLNSSILSLSSWSILKLVTICARLGATC